MKKVAKTDTPPARSPSPILEDPSVSFINTEIDERDGQIFDDDNEKEVSPQGVLLCLFKIPSGILVWRIVSTEYKFVSSRL